MNKISCIICAFNEEPRINIVLNALIGHPLIDEVIVVDDGSTDGTKTSVEKYKWVKLISHPNNLGKSQAVRTGILNSKNELLMFLDADLRNITDQDITALVLPVLENKSDITISTRKNGMFAFKLLGLDFISGERVIPKKYLADCVEEIGQLPGFGIEVFMNRIIISNNLRVKIVHWKKVMIT